MDCIAFTSCERAAATNSFTASSGVANTFCFASAANEGAAHIHARDKATTRTRRNMTVKFVWIGNMAFSVDLIRVYLRLSAVDFLPASAAAATASAPAAGAACPGAGAARSTAAAEIARLAAAANAVEAAAPAIAESATSVADSTATVPRSASAVRCPTRAVGNTGAAIAAPGAVAGRNIPAYPFSVTRNVLPPLLRAAAELLARIHARPLALAEFVLAAFVAILHALAMLGVVVPVPVLDVGLVEVVVRIVIDIDATAAPVAAAPERTANRHAHREGKKRCAGRIV